jgi:hypothetical protein
MYARDTATQSLLAKDPAAKKAVEVIHTINFRDAHFPSH